MSSIPELRCLFCNHGNPAGARFCNDCGSPLDLQPCDACGAIDKRSASACYKCAAPFPVSTVTVEVAVDTELGGVEQPARSAATVLDASCAALAEQGLSEQRLPVPEAAAELAYRDQPDALPAESAIKFQLLPGRPSPEAAAGGESPRVFRLALAALLLASIAGFAYYYHFRQPAAQPDDRLAAAAGGQVSRGTPLAAVTPGDTVAAGQSRQEAAPAPMSTGDLPPGARPNEFRDCPEAVAALGLCRASGQPGRP